jgi:hypothetical protein
MRREMRVRSLLAVIAIVPLIAWLLFTGSFVRGILVGVVSTLGVLAAGVFLVGKRLRKRAGSNLPPPPLPTEMPIYLLTFVSGLAVSPGNRP